jgi:hypothetical protein
MAKNLLLRVHLCKRKDVDIVLGVPIGDVLFRDGCIMRRSNPGLL